MSRLQLNRRQMLAAGALTTLAATMQKPSRGQDPRPATPTVGIATMGFRECTNAELAELLVAEDLKTIQLFLTQKDSNYWKYNGRSDLVGLTESRCREIADTYRSAGIAIHSIGVYTNLIHPDPAERKANLAYFEAMMRVGVWMNVRTFITEAGHYYNPAEPAPSVEYHFQQEVWDRMVATGRQLAGLAEQHDAVVLCEPFYRHFLASAKRTRLYLEEVGSPRIRALLDPANLLEVNDLPEMFEQLGTYIDCLHAKDRKLHVDRGVPAGQGDLDYGKFVELAAHVTPRAVDPGVRWAKRLPAGSHASAAGAGRSDELSLYVPGQEDLGPDNDSLRRSHALSCRCRSRHGHFHATHISAQKIESHQQQAEANKPRPPKPTTREPICCATRTYHWKVWSLPRLLHFSRTVRSTCTPPGQ